MGKIALSDIKIAYIGGGSRAWARALMSDLASQEYFTGTVNLFDLDEKAANDNCIIGNKLNDNKKTKNRWNYQVKSSLKEALEDADFVIISIIPGTFTEMKSDVHTPEKYGIYQAVGDTVGPGGILRAMRLIPMYEVIANAIKDYAPSAWVINYSNPMSICVRTLYRIFPEIKALGCCHEVFHTQYLLTKALEDLREIKGVKRQDIQTEVCGINHFTYITKADYNDIDLFKVYNELVEKNYISGYNPDGTTEDFKQNVFLCSNRVKFDLYKRYRLIAAGGDRHLAEFCPSSWYLKDRKTVEEWKFNLTPVDWRIKDKEQKIKITEEYIKGEKEFEIFYTGEEGTEIMAALLGLKDMVTNINYPNIGQYVEAPKGSIVETNMKISKNKVEMVAPVSLPDNLNAMIIRHIYNQQTVVDAAIERDVDKMFTALVNDPLCSKLDLNESKALFNEMMDNTKNYLTSWNLK